MEPTQAPAPSQEKQPIIKLSRTKLKITEVYSIFSWTFWIAYTMS
jgi:hypothetical protein